MKRTCFFYSAMKRILIKKGRCEKFSLILIFRTRCNKLSLKLLSSFNVFNEINVSIFACYLNNYFTISSILLLFQIYCLLRNAFSSVVRRTTSQLYYMLLVNNTQNQNVRQNMTHIRFIIISVSRKNRLL